MPYGSLRDLLDAYYAGCTTLDVVLDYLDDYGYSFEVCRITGIVSVFDGIDSDYEYDCEVM